MRIVSFGEDKFAVEETTKFLFWEFGLGRYYDVPETYIEDWGKIEMSYLYLNPREDVSPVSDIEYCRAFILQYNHSKYKQSQREEYKKKRQKDLLSYKKVIK